jgi:toxin FitB
MLLDTNVLSEIRKLNHHRANPVFARWALSLDISHTWISVIAIRELEYGVASLARHDATQAAMLHRWVHDGILPSYAGRTLDVTTEVALRCAHLHVPDPRPERDALIAATALVHGLVVVTRNVRDFEPMGVSVLNPWEP